MTTLKVEIYKDRLLVLTGTEEQLQPLTAAPKHWLLPGGGLAVPWTWRDSAWLTAQGVPAVSPIFRDYDWPMPTDWRLMSHQARIADFCVRNRRGYVLAGTGSGKSASLTWATDYLLQVGAVKRVLVIAPLSVMSDAWTPTLGRLLLGRRRHAELYGTKELRLARARGDHDYHIINVDGLKNDEVHAQLMRNKYDAVVIDESTMIKTASTARWKLVKPLVDQATFAWQLTGTPTPQGPDDAHGQLKMFDRFGTLDMPLTWWQNLTSYKVTKFKRVPLAGWQDTVHKYMRPAISFKTRDCIDLPPITYIHRKVPITKVQEKAIAALLTHNAVRLDGQLVQAPNQAIVFAKLAQILAGAAYGEDGTVIEVRPTQRLEETAHIMGQAEGKVIVFAPIKAAVRLIAEDMRKRGFKVATITGDVSKNQRQKIFDEFQKPGRETLDGLIAVPDAMSHGVTLTEASDTVWYAPVSKAEVYQQAIARMERQGQKRHMNVVHLWGHPRERDLYDALKSRGKGASKLQALYDKLVRGDMT